MSGRLLGSHQGIGQAGWRLGCGWLGRRLWLAAGIEWS